jgi:hypothetical protein
MLDTTSRATIRSRLCFVAPLLPARWTVKATEMEEGSRMVRERGRRESLWFLGLLEYRRLQMGGFDEMVEDAWKVARGPQQVPRVAFGRLLWWA